MMILVSYDVCTEDNAGKTRLRRVAKTCEQYGQRVQKSMFECLVPPDILVRLKNALEKEMDKKKDSIRIYYLGNNWEKRVEHIGANEGYNPEGFLII